MFFLVFIVVLRNGLIYGLKVFFSFFFFLNCCLTLHVVTDAKDMSWLKTWYIFSPKEMNA